MSSTPPAGNEGREIAGHRLAAEARNEARQVISMGPDIAEAAGAAAALGIGAPGRLLIAGPLQWRRQPVLGVFYLDDAQPTEASLAATISRA